MNPLNPFHLFKEIAKPADAERLRLPNADPAMVPEEASSSLARLREEIGYLRSIPPGPVERQLSNVVNLADYYNGSRASEYSVEEYGDGQQAA